MNSVFPLHVGKLSALHQGTGLLSEMKLGAPAHLLLSFPPSGRGPALATGVQYAPDCRLSSLSPRAGRTHENSERLVHIECHSQSRSSAGGFHPSLFFLKNLNPCMYF